MTVTHPTAPLVAIEFDSDLIRRLRRDARERDVPVQSLIRDVLYVVERDRLVAAILDDGPPKRRC
jgi:hypothetical protein